MYRFSVAFLAASALIAGCNNGDSGDDSDTAECENQVISLFPADGATDAYYRTTVEVEFDDAEDDATFTVSSSAGDVAGDFAWVGDKLVFTPDAPLSPNTDYTTSVTFSCGTPSADWRTDAVGAAVTGDLTGRSYLLDLTSGRFVQPEGVGDIIGEYLDQIVLIGVDSVDTGANEIDMLGALGVQGTTGGAHTEDDSVSHIEQDSCLPSIAFPPGIDFAGNPYFKAGPADTTLSVAGFTVTVEDLAISGAFAPDASYIAGATLAGKIDTRPLVPLLSSDPAPCDQATYNDGSNPTAPNPNYPCDPATICTLAASLFVECEPCGSASTATVCGTEAGEDACCLTLLVDSINAVELLDDDPTADSSFALTELGDLGTGDANDPCVVNANECASEPDCL